MLLGSKNANSITGVVSSLLLIAIAIVGLVYGKNFLIPIVIALLIANLIGAGADRLMGLGLSGPVAMFCAIFIVLLGIFSVFKVLAHQVDGLGEAWPRYVSRLEVVADWASRWAGAEVSKRIGETLRSLDLTRSIPSFIGSAAAFLSSVGLVAIYVGFLLAERGKLTGRIALLFTATEEAARVQGALAAISAGVHSYLWIKTITSLLTGAVSYAVLKALGVDFSETWALLIFLLNYIPNIGSILGVVFPALLALVQFETIWQFLVIAVLLAAGQFVIGNVIEPRYMGRTLNLSPFVVMVALAFWATIWGIAGAFLSIPLTAALVITCGHIPSLRWIAVLLSEDGRISVTSPGETSRATNLSSKSD
ncbi:MAG: AI-2E family transporter [Hyphomicrobiaceae bacterium]